MGQAHTAGRGVTAWRRVWKRLLKLKMHTWLPAALLLVYSTEEFLDIRLALRASWVTGMPQRTFSRGGEGQRGASDSGHHTEAERLPASAGVRPVVRGRGSIKTELKITFNISTFCHKDKVKFLKIYFSYTRNPV